MAGWLRRLFVCLSVRQVPLEAPPGFLGSDGVHPSAVGWRSLVSCVRECAQWLVPLNTRSCVHLVICGVYLYVPAGFVSPVVLFDAGDGMSVP